MPSGRASLFRASPTGPGPLVAAAGAMRSPRFRTKDFSTRMGSPTAQGPSHTRHSSHEMMLPSPQRKKISTLEMPVSQLNTQLMVSPVNASRQPSRAAAHHSGPGRLARPYPVVDFHLLSFASLSWRTLLLATSRPPVARNRLPLYPRKPTFLWPLLTSGCDPEPPFTDSPRSSIADALYKGALIVTHRDRATLRDS